MVDAGSGLERRAGSFRWCEGFWGRQHGEGTELLVEEPQFMLCLLERKWVS